MSDLLCIGGPLDGKRVRIPNVSTKLETALDIEGSYTRVRLRRCVKNYMTRPHPIAYLESSSVLVWNWDESIDSLPNARLTQTRLDESDWTRVAGTEMRIPEIGEEANDAR